MLIGHVTGFRHGRRNLNRVPKHMDVLGSNRLEGQKVNLAPALVGRCQAAFDGNIAGPHMGNHVEHRRLQIVIELELERVGGNVYIDDFVRWAVFNDALVALGPGFLEECTLGRHIFVGIQNQHLAFRLGLAEVAGNLAGALVRAWRAAVRCQRNRQGINTAVRHGFELLAQGHGLRAGLPAVQNLFLRAVFGHAWQGVPHEVNAGRKNQPVIGQLAATGQPHNTLVGVNLVNHVLHQPHAVMTHQLVIRRRDICQGLAAAQYQIGEWAGNESAVRLNQRDLNTVVRPHADIFSRCGATVATTHHHDFGAVGARAGGAT